MKETKVLFFEDRRSLHEIQAELEGELMAVFQVAQVEPLLTLSVKVPVAGVPHLLTLRWEAAQFLKNSYSLRVALLDSSTVSSTDPAYTRSLDSWLSFWMRNLKPSAPPLPGSGLGERYQECVQASLHAEDHLVDVPSMQREIMGRMREGAYFATAHKEGGTRIGFRRGRFVREDYGESNGQTVFRSEGEFLTSLRQFYDWQTSQHTYPERVTDEVAWKLILRLLRYDGYGPFTAGAPGGSRTVDLGFLCRYRRLSVWLGVLVAVVAIACGVAYRTFSVKTVGAPLGEGLGTPEFVAMLIETQEPYLPSLQGNPEQARFQVRLMIQPRSPGAGRRLIRVQKNLRAAEAQNSCRILGFDGKLLWILSPELLAYDYQAGRVIGLEKIRRVNPALESLWGQGFYEVAGRLRVSTRDRGTLVEINPETLLATYLPWPRAEQAPARLAKQSLNFYLQPLAASDPARLDPAILRDEAGVSTLKLSNPEGHMLTYWKKIKLFERHLVVARVDANGKTVWETDTGIDTLHQVFPHQHHVAFYGTRPSVPGKLPEPLLVVLETATGDSAVHSLWMFD